jgi:DNA polymerase
MAGGPSIDVARDGVTQPAGATASVVLAGETDWQGWRQASRALVLTGVPPDAIAWSVGPAPVLPEPPQEAAAFGVPRTLVALAEAAIQARDPDRFALLYRLVWRVQRGERALLDQHDDPDLRGARALVLSVRQDRHRMQAQLRFRAVEDAAGRLHLGWYEPAHHVLGAVAAGFARHFPALRFAILTPDASAHWDGASMRAGPGAAAAEVVDDAALEAVWRARFAAAGLPEAPPALGDGGPEPEFRPPDLPPLGPVRIAPPTGAAALGAAALAEARQHAATCRRCPLHGPATQTVFGEGPTDARILFVGEQPGDQEDVIGRPFVGPAGQLLDRAFEQAGIDRRLAYVANAVKHFKFTLRGRRRIHQTPETPEISACRFWLDAELAAVTPDLVVLLGATAARAMLGRAVSVGRERGRRIALPDGRPALITVHPSFLLRLPDEAAKAREWRALQADLAEARALATALAARRE